MTASPQLGKFDEVRQALEQLNSEARSADDLMKGITLLLQRKTAEVQLGGLLHAGTQEPTRRCWFWGIIREL